jgi:hypothetical protein
MILEYFDDSVRVTGPYYNKRDQRKTVTMRCLKTGKVTQKTYAKYLMEIHLGRILSKYETVDHVDRNSLNDSLDNLRIVDPSKHSSEDNLRSTMITVSCPMCGVQFERTPRYMRAKSKRGIAGPFCGAKCRGKYGAQVQNGGNRLPPQENIASTYYYVEK